MKGLEHELRARSITSVSKCRNTRAKNSNAEILIKKECINELIKQVNPFRKYNDKEISKTDQSNRCFDFVKKKYNGTIDVEGIMNMLASN